MNVVIISYCISLNIQTAEGSRSSPFLTYYFNCNSFFTKKQNKNKITMKNRSIGSTCHDFVVDQFLLDTLITHLSSLIMLKYLLFFILQYTLHLHAVDVNPGTLWLCQSREMIEIKQDNKDMIKICTIYKQLRYNIILGKYYLMIYFQ